MVGGVRRGHTKILCLCTCLCVHRMAMHVVRIIDINWRNTISHETEKEVTRALIMVLKLV